MAKQQTSPNNKRGDMIYCERCGEDYSATYRRCPFCDERPGRRIDDHGYSTRSPLRLAVLIGSLVLILAAAFIVFSKVAPLLTNKEPAPAPDAPGNEVVEPVTPELPGTAEPDPEPVNPNAVPANAVVLSRTDMTLAPNEAFSILATVAPANTTDTLVWSCDKPDILTVNQDGSVVNNNATGEKVVVTVTATAGGVSAECVVRCNSGAVAPKPPAGGSVAANSQGKITGAGNGLNVRSGPGSNYEKIASIANGTKVTVLESANGWYKVDYGNGKTGYVSADYVQITSSGSGSSSGSTGTSSGTSSGSSSGSTSSGASISGKTPAKVTGAGNGLNVRSGPGSNYEKIASIENGSSVVILENAGNGWYKIDYGNGKTGYASVDYIKPK